MRRPPAGAGADLAAALLRGLTGIEGADRALAAAVRNLARLPASASAPASISELCGIVGEVPGVRLDRLLTQLADSAAVQDALDVLLTRARAQADPDAQLARHLAAWDPVIAGLTAARGGDDQARTAVEQHLAEYRDSADWAKLAAALRTILHGDHGADLPGGLDGIDTAIARRALAALNGDVQLPGQLWQALPLTWLIVRVVDAAYGDQDAARQVTEALTELGNDSDWAPLANALRRILDGDRAPGLAGGLDPVFSAAVATIVSHLPPPAQPVTAREMP